MAPALWPAAAPQPGVVVTHPVAAVLEVPLVQAVLKVP
jgi:hypothetical protein